MTVSTNDFQHSQGLMTSASRRDMRRIVAGGVAGQVVEFYDYAL